MEKYKEILCRTSCLNKAREDEKIFVLLGRDRSTPFAIRAWVEHRIKSGKNVETDSQIIEALGLAEDIERDHVIGVKY